MESTNGSSDDSKRPEFGGGDFAPRSPLRRAFEVDVAFWTWMGES